MKKMTLVLTILSTLLIAARAEAQIVEPYPPANAISLGQPAFGGTGCRDNSAELQFDGNRLSIYFSNFKTQLQGAKVKTERKNCSLRLPISIKPGYQLIVTDLDVEGSVFKNNKFIVQTNTSVGFIGGLTVQGIDLKAVSQNGLILIHKSLINQDAVYTQCDQATAMLALSTASVGSMPKVASKAQLQSEIRSARIGLAVIPCHIQ
jgi:Domain of unknown function (DUF4360)